MRPPPTSLSRAAVLLLGGWLLVGVAYISTLPPWEGFDETAHYSYLQQLIDSSNLPRRGASFLSTAVEEYSQRAPMPYDTAPLRFTYHTFFAAPPLTVAAGRRHVHDRPSARRRYVASRSANWERKHPPLAYLVTGPVYLRTAQWSWAAHLWSLRFTSYLLAWAALVVATCACAASARSASGEWRARWQWGVLGVSAWPAFFPAWFPEMARLGNDGLSALIASLLWLVIAHPRRAIARFDTALIAGLLLGLGSLTKAFFLPLAGTVAVYMCVREDDERPFARRGAAAALMLVVAAAVAGWWYLQNGQTYYNILTSTRMGGLASGLERHFAIAPWIRGHAALVTTVAWPGSWSFARPPYLWFLPMSLLVLIALAAYGSALARIRASDVRSLPAWLVTPILAILSYYVLLRVAATGEGRVAAGYYLHFLAGPLGFALGVALARWWPRRPFRLVVQLLLVYAVVFAAAMAWAQLLLFAGIFTKSADKFYELAAPLPAVAGVPEALDRLASLAYPRLGLACWSAGTILVLIGLAGARHAASRLVSCHSDSRHNSRTGPQRAGFSATHAIR